MPEFFVWSTPLSIEVVKAESEQDAAEEFLTASHQINPFSMSRQRASCSAPKAEILPMRRNRPSGFGSATVTIG